jgi:hypothetical protein
MPRAAHPLAETRSSSGRSVLVHVPGGGVGFAGGGGLLGGLGAGEEDLFDAGSAGRGQVAGHRIDAVDDDSGGLDEALDAAIVKRGLHDL